MFRFSAGLPLKLASLFIPMATLVAGLGSSQSFARNSSSSPMIVDGKNSSYGFLKEAAKKWRICALLPNGHDRYFWASAWGLSQQADREGVEIGIYDAGGYDRGDVQHQQLENCIAQGADAYLIAAIPGPTLDSDLAHLSRLGKPVIDLINGIHSPYVLSHSHDDFKLMAETAAQCIVKDSAKRAVTVAWFPGPAKSVWTEEFTQGIRIAFAHTPIHVIATETAATDIASQIALIRKVLKDNRVDYVFGNALAAEAATRYLKATPSSSTQVVSVYSNEAIVDLIRENAVLCAANDQPALLSRVAVDLAVRALEKKKLPKRVAPHPQLLTRDNINEVDLDQLLAPRNIWFIRRNLSPLPTPPSH